MDWQILIAGLAVAAAAVFLVWRGIGVFRPLDGACAGGCGCAKGPASSKAGLIAPEDLRIRSSEPEASAKDC